MNTKQKIILAAAEEFAEKGYTTTTTRDICRKVKMNTAAANYHFNTKQELYRQVFLYLFDSETDKSPNTEINIESFKDWETNIRKWILDFLLSMTSSSPLYRWRTILIAREMTNPSEIFPWLCDYYFKPFIVELQAYFEYIFPKKQNEEILYEVFSLLSQCLFYVQNRSIAEYAFGKQIYTKEKLSKIADHIYKSIETKIPMA